MRTFEMLMLAANVFTLLLCFGKQPKTIRLWMTGLNLCVLLIHFLFEGVRYQMFFSYFFIAVFAGYTWIKTTGKFPRLKLPKAIKFVFAGLSGIALAFTSFMAYALPVFSLPNPTGSYDVGVKYFQLVNEKSNDPFLDPPAQKRELMIKVFYPAKKDGSPPNSPYFHDSPKMIRAFTGFYQGLPSFLFDHLILVKTNSKENLQVSDKQPGYPVVLFSHGAGSSIEVHTSQCEDLASHGYIVVAIDHTYVSAATEFPDRIVLHSGATKDFRAAEPAEMISQIMAEDAKFVMDKLEDLNAGTMGALFKGKLDLDRIGVIGHSVGGAAAYHLAINDHRIKAAINLDGFVYTAPEKKIGDIPPFLMLANDRFHIPMFQNPQDNRNLLRLAEVVKASGNLYTIQGSDHMNFTDIGLFFGVKPLRELIGIGGETPPVKVLEITESLTAAFFDRHLKAESDDSLESLGDRYPELKKIALS